MLWIAAAGAVFVSLAGCDRPDDALVVYVSADEQIATPILQSFTAKTGIAVRPLFDTEATKTTGLASRLRREQDRPLADLFWSSEPFAVELLARDGVLQPAVSPMLLEHPRQWRDPDGRWFAFAGRARVLVFDPEVLRAKGAERPTAWTDLTKDRFGDQIVMADPRFGTTRGHLGAFKAYADRAIMPGYYSAWLEGLAENGITLLPGGNAAVVDAVVRGEAMIGLTDTDDVFQAQAKGYAIDFVYPRHDVTGVKGGGTLVVPNAAGIVAGSGRVEAATALLAYLVSPEVERALHASPSHNLPLVAPTAEPIDPRFVVPDPLGVSVGEAATAMNEAVDEAMRRLDPERIKGMRAPRAPRKAPS